MDALSSALRVRGDAGHYSRVIERGVEPVGLAHGAVHHRGYLRVVTDVAPYGDCLVSGGNHFSALQCFTASSLKSLSRPPLLLRRMRALDSGAGVELATDRLKQISQAAGAG